MYKGRKAKLTAAQTEELRDRLGKGESATKLLAAEYGISRASVYNYRVSRAA